MDPFREVINHNVKISMPEAIHKLAAGGGEKATKPTTRRHDVLAVALSHISTVSSYFFVLSQVTRELSVHSKQVQAQACINTQCIANKIVHQQIVINGRLAFNDEIPWDFCSHLWIPEDLWLKIM